jgi:hypothetical protein
MTGDAEAEAEAEKTCGARGCDVGVGAKLD